MKKICSKCNYLKPLTEFHTRKDSSDGYRKECKECKKKDTARQYQFRKETTTRNDYNKDPYYTVYYLPEHHYVGMTNYLKRRMREHKKKGKIIEGYEVVGRYKTAIQAHLYETMLHAMGYEGFKYGNEQTRTQVRKQSTIFDVIG